MTTLTSREIHLKQRPNGVPTAADFELATVSVPAPGPGQMVVRNVFMSVDPYMRGRMVERESYVPPFKLGAVLEGGAIGQVVESNDGPYPVGAYISHMAGWRDYAVIGGAGVMPVDPKAPLSAYLGVLGMPGMTAYAGLLKHGNPQQGETVFVSAAAGAVGSLVCQIAKIKGCSVIGTAGSDDKVKYLLEEVGCDFALNYKTAGDLTRAISAKMPKGVDIYFENVGGAHLVAALNVMRPFGRIAVCGMIDQYNATTMPEGPGNIVQVIPKRINIRGFIVSDHYDMLPDFMKDMTQWIAEGRIKWRETVYEGLDSAPDAFVGLFQGDNLGKAVVRIGPDKV
jgi:NADPH-dependent curcumin reductase CurA